MSINQLINSESYFNAMYLEHCFKKLFVFVSSKEFLQLLLKTIILIIFMGYLSLITPDYVIKCFLIAHLFFKGPHLIPCPFIPIASALIFIVLITTIDSLFAYYSC